MSPRALLNFIDGAFVAARSGETLPSFAPSTGQVHATAARSRAADVQDAVAAARRAFAGPWRRWGIEERAKLLDKIADGVQSRMDEFAALESLDQGKPVKLARGMDINRVVHNFRFFAGLLRQQDTPAFTADGALNYAHRAPLGVVGLITPWNLPLYLLTWKLAPALAMGNTMVVKPSELTPATATLLMEVLRDCGLPPGVVNLVHGYGAEAGQALVEHPEVCAISFTGGTVTGRRLAAVAAPMLKKLSLELGGKNATVVFADADFEHAVATATRAAFTNQGEICLCGSRVLVERSIYEPFLAALTERAGALQVGDPADPTTDIGALVSEAHREKVESYLSLAREEGGVVLCGGERPALPAPFSGGYFLSPAVVAGLSSRCRVATEEIFGPVVTVHPFDTDEEALQMANGVGYGLSASVFTQSLDRAHRFSRNLEVGMVWVNTWMNRDLRTPFGGVKESGVGREGGRWSMEFYSEYRNICLRLDEGSRA